jgi:hypothetical protein
MVQVASVCPCGGRGDRKEVPHILQLGALLAAISRLLDNEQYVIDVRYLQEAFQGSPETDDIFDGAPRSTWYVPQLLGSVLLVSQYPCRAS